MNLGLALSQRLLGLLLFLALPLTTSAGGKEDRGRGPGRLVVANRGTGDLSIINARTDKLLRQVSLPTGSNFPEPMYVVATPAHNLFWVGDRANNRVVAFHARSLRVVGSVPAGAGVFHMWADQAGRQLWVVNDIDNTVSVIDPRKRQLIATVPMPGDLIADGAKPHDVIVHPRGRFAYVTFLNTSDPITDAVVQFETTTFTERCRQLVGEDPHLSFNKKRNELYMPCQGSNLVQVLDARTLAIKKALEVPGAHGAITSHNSRRFFTTNISGGGIGAIYSIGTRRNEILDTVDTIAPTPHNLTITPNGKKIFVTHSGSTADKVSSIHVAADGSLCFGKEIPVGLNPFGLAYVK